ncbi:MAG: zinc ribbon domain-containing protein [Elusimicrobia bacterium]|nr:zinc ribbon domain-containing protein [Elusimicrobiota bacterium]
MPLYEYSCRKCRADFDVLHLPGRDAKTSCPKCESEDVFQKISTFSAHGSSSKGNEGFSCEEGSCPGRRPDGSCGAGDGLT